MPRLALIRHGHTVWNRDGRLQGRTDIPLDDHARTELAAQKLPGTWADADVVSSPLERARETAALISDRTPDTIDALMEMDWGTFEGKISADLRADPTSGFRDIEHWGWDYCPHGGETPAQLWARVAPWLDTLTHDCVAVCHIGTMRVILAKAHGWDFDGPAPFQIKRNRLFTLDINGALDLRPAEITRLDTRAS
ncbi:MAG: histidine phosphatase family protein [Pseudomonadota bacterium]